MSKRLVDIFTGVKEEREISNPWRETAIKSMYAEGNPFVYLKSFFVTEVFVDHFIEFLHRTCMGKMFEKHFWCIFVGAYTDQKAPKHVCMQHC